MRVLRHIWGPGIQMAGEALWPLDLATGRTSETSGLLGWGGFRCQRVPMGASGGIPDLYGTGRMTAPRSSDSLRDLFADSRILLHVSKVRCGCGCGSRDVAVFHVGYEDMSLSLACADGRFSLTPHSFTMTIPSRHSDRGVA